MVNPVVSSCGARGCIDVYDPVRVKRLKEWAESDAKFLKRLSMKKEEEDHHQHHHHRRRRHHKMIKKKGNHEEEGLFRFVTCERSESFDRFTFRQRYLRSYTFSEPKKEDNYSKETIKKMIINKLHLKKKTKKEGSSNSLLRDCFKFFLSCVAQVDVHAH